MDVRGKSQKLEVPEKVSARVGAALRGRPQSKGNVFRNQRGAATEGRPYMHEITGAIQGLLITSNTG